jgi:hypothetical protein
MNYFVSLKGYTNIKKHNERLKVVKLYIYNCLWRKANLISDVSVLHNVGGINIVL